MNLCLKNWRSLVNKQGEDLSLVRVKVILWLMVSRPVCFGVKHPSGAYDHTSNFYYCQSCGFVDVGRSLWREKGSALYSCFWSSPAQSLLGSSPTGLVTIFYCLRFKTPPTWGPGPRIYIPQEQGGTVIPPGTGFSPSLCIALSFAYITSRGTYRKHVHCITTDAYCCSILL
jgi:hypothetical protein